MFFHPDQGLGFECLAENMCDGTKLLVAKLQMNPIASAEIFGSGSETRNSVTGPILGCVLGPFPRTRLIFAASIWETGNRYVKIVSKRW